MIFVMPPLFKFCLAISLLLLPMLNGHAQSSPADARQQELSDTLRIVRKGLTTSLYQQEEKRSYRELLELYQDTPHGLKPLRWSRPLRIAGPVVAVGGVALGAVALKGVQRTVVIEEKTYHYTERSKPKLLGGLLLLAGGLCLFELSNDLVARSGKAYNQAYIARKLLSETKVGITPLGGVGVVAGF